MKKQEIAKQMTQNELHYSLYISQSILFVVGFISSIFVYKTISDVIFLFEIKLGQMFLYGIMPAIVVVLIDYILSQVLPKKMLDDGGINEKLFKDLPVYKIAFIALIVAISEEVFFRGFLQGLFGFIIASIIFALIHFRYLRKPVLFLSVVFVSFLLGFIFEQTGNLIVVIVFHFTLDFLLGLLIRYRKI